MAIRRALISDDMGRAQEGYKLEELETEHIAQSQVSRSSSNPSSETKSNVPRQICVSASSSPQILAQFFPNEAVSRLPLQSIANRTGSSRQVRQDRKILQGLLPPPHQTRRPQPPKIEDEGGDATFAGYSRHSEPSCRSPRSRG
ncbi:hypothetical protein QR685DRAFT_62081 [Neurospora intermedia]|uniref:Uncharacterized protein n=1 Tax=Neurospora intermedia TaxID=5142 RepID=A0ABR3DT69_NEUIN